MSSARPLLIMSWLGLKANRKLGCLWVNELFLGKKYKKKALPVKQGLIILLLVVCKVSLYLGQKVVVFFVQIGVVTLQMFKISRL